MLGFTKQHSITLHNITERDTKAEKKLTVKARNEVKLSQCVEADQKRVAFCTVNTAHILTVKISTNKCT